MKSLFISAFAVLVVALAANGCTSSADGTSVQRLCTPGAYVFCKCAEGGDGTKLCDADGAGFGTCATTADGTCKGGEVNDPNTGKAVVSKDNPAIVPTPIASNDCPGQATAIDPGVTVTINGDTTNATMDRSGKAGACAVSVGANDQVYHLVPSSSGSLHVEVQGTGTLNPVTYLRTVCDDASAQASCGPAGAKNFTQFTVNVAAKRDYYLFVDGASSSVGAYTASIALTAGAVCGDGVVDSGEACDDGNHNEDDGCSASCKNPNGNPASASSCPGQPVDLWALGATVTGSGSNLNADANNTGAWNAPNTNCAVTGTNAYQDHIYAVTPHVTGTMSVTVSGSTANLMLVARSTCATAASQLACANNALAGGPEMFSIPVTSGTPVYVAVDGGSAKNNAGAYSIAFQVQ